MDKLELFRLDGIQYDVPIFEYKVSKAFLSGAATERTKAPGARLLRVPEGIFTNLQVTFGRIREDNNDVLELLSKLESYKNTDFLLVEFYTPLRRISQYMYAGDYDLTMTARGAEHPEAVKWGNLIVNFVAREAEL